MVVDLTNRYKVNEEKGIVKYTVKAHGEYYTGVAKTNFEDEASSFERSAFNPRGYA